MALAAVVARIARALHRPAAPQFAVAGAPLAAPTPSAQALLDVLHDALLLAVPKHKKSYRRKRIRQMAPEKQLDNKQHMYPCPKCEHGYLKLRHHLCPCDMEAANIKPKKVQYGAYRTGQFAAER